MLIRAIKQFRERTWEQYKKEEEKNMEQWKKDVLFLHEQSAFLFYFDEAKAEKNSLLKYEVRGEIAKGTPKIGSLCRMYDGQGQMLGEAEILTDSEDEEEKQLGLIRMKKNRFIIRITSLWGEDTTSMEVKKFQRQIRKLFADLSLVSDWRLEEKH